MLAIKSFIKYVFVFFKLTFCFSYKLILEEVIRYTVIEFWRGRWSMCVFTVVATGENIVNLNIL